MWLNWVLCSGSCKATVKGSSRMRSRWSPASSSKLMQTVGRIYLVSCGCKTETLSCPGLPPPRAVYSTAIYSRPAGKQLCASNHKETWTLF